MFCRAIDNQAYIKILNYELFLRKILRWELRGIFGDKAFLQLGELSDEINFRIGAEKKNGAHNKDSSSFSYLTLNELIYAIVENLWDRILEPVFKNKKYLVKEDLKQLICVRNKISHFRPLRNSDLLIFSDIESMVHKLQNYYRDSMKSAAYIPGERGYEDQQIDPDEILLLENGFRNVSREGLWFEFQKNESIRSRGLSPGIGIIGHHCFFELYSSGSFRAKELVEFTLKHEYEITFLNIGPRANYVRVFVPLSIEEKIQKKILRKFFKSGEQANSNEMPSLESIKSDYDIGYLESINAENINSYVGFVF